MASKGLGGSSDKCTGCGKVVYATEKLTAGSHVFHKACFKCAQCGTKLTMNTYSVHNGTFLCKPHYNAATLGKAPQGHESFVGTAPHTTPTASAKQSNVKPAPAASPKPPTTPSTTKQSASAQTQQTSAPTDYEHVFCPQRNVSL
jgi:recombinational DNA repair protein (RecF pathway)